MGLKGKSVGAYYDIGCAWALNKFNSGVFSRKVQTGVSGISPVFCTFCGILKHSWEQENVFHLLRSFARSSESLSSLVWDEFQQFVFLPRKETEKMIKWM